MGPDSNVSAQSADTSGAADDEPDATRRLSQPELRPSGFGWRGTRDEHLQRRGTPRQPRSFTNALVGQTMGFVATAAGLFTLGGYVGRNLTGGAAARAV